MVGPEVMRDGDENGVNCNKGWEKFRAWDTRSTEAVHEGLRGLSFPGFPSSGQAGDGAASNELCEDVNGRQSHHDSHNIEGDAVPEEISGL